MHKARQETGDTIHVPGQLPRHPSLRDCRFNPNYDCFARGMLETKLVAKLLFIVYQIIVFYGHGKLVFRLPNARSRGTQFWGLTNYVMVPLTTTL